MNFPELEEKILKNWNQIQAFKKSVEKRPRDRTFVFYEGPPTANGRPGFHHVEARSYKDVVCRYKTMRGFRVERRAGWDTHGLPVEIQVEKELGLNSKKDIEKYGIAEFNAKCRESVWRYQKEWEEITERMGFWVDMDDPYITLSPTYMESLWWIMKQAHKKELLYEGHKVVPRCMRCGTALSSHEVAQGYKDVTDESVYIKFKLRDPESFSKLKLEDVEPKVYFLAWTTTPWTLPGNVALAVGKDIKYSVARQGDEYYVLAEELLEVLEGEYEVVSEVKGKDLVDLEYEPLFNSLKDAEGKKFVIVPADFVSTEDGTGIVHTAVMYGEDDYQLGKEFGLPTVHTVDEAGNFNELVKEFEGRHVKEAETDIIDHLRKNSLLYKALSYEHSYPFCWRCGEPLLYYAMHSWFIGMEKLKDELMEANDKVNWVPAHIKEGRFGEWLRNVKDWAFSRSRYWGTPLPVWKCDEEHIEVVGSREDLAQLTKGKNRYWLMRHGHSGNNGEEILVSDPATNHPLDKLSEKGKEQVAASIEELKKEGGADVVVTSPLGRTSETAKLVGEALDAEVVTEDLLKEINVGIYEGKTEKEYGDFFEGEEDYNFTKAVPEGENLATVRRRMLDVMNALEEKYEGKNIVVVSHGHPLWVLETALQGHTIKEANEWKESGEYPQNAQLRKVEYAKFPYNNEGELDFHRPFVDEIEFPCSDCKKPMRRVEDLVDVWFDSGSMPFAQQHYPFENKDAIDKGKEYPADYITEAMDQTRGWFYTLLAVSVILGKAPSYKNVITLGIVLDENGQKMSKSKGNIVDPWELASKYGMDAVRWYFFTVNQPGDAKLFSERDVKDRWQRFLSTFANSYTFFNTYAQGVKPPAELSAKDGNVLDRWIVTRLREVSSSVAEYVDDYNILDAARTLENFVVEDLSNWYIRRSRGRLQRPKDKKEKDQAAATLAFVLNETSKITAPFVPFVSEHVWQGLNETETESVHWQEYPSFARDRSGKDDEALIAVMADVRLWSQTALRLRSDNGIKVRQPLEALAVPKDISEDLKEVLKDELNVKEVVEFSKEMAGSDDWEHDGKVALKTQLSEALVTEGQAREMMRHIQNMRRKLGLKPADNIQVQYSLGPDLAGKLSEFEGEIAQTTNSSQILESSNVEEHGYDMFSEYSWDPQHKVRIGIKRVK